jgi:hypothetical protein
VIPERISFALTKRNRKAGCPPEPVLSLAKGGHDGGGSLERFTIGCTVLPPAGNRAATVRERCPGRLLTRAARTVSSYRTGKGNLL